MVLAARAALLEHAHLLWYLSTAERIFCALTPPPRELGRCEEPHRSPLQQQHSAPRKRKVEEEFSSFEGEAVEVQHGGPGPGEDEGAAHGGGARPQGHAPSARPAAGEDRTTRVVVEALRGAVLGVVGAMALAIRWCW